MPLDADKLMALKIPTVEHSYGPRDCMLYALGLGLGQDPLNADELAFVYEKNLKVLPTYALVQGYSAYWLRQPDLGITWSHVVHGEQGLMLHESVAPQGTVIGRTRIVDVVDKGEGKGALVFSERAISDKASGRLLATLTQTTFCRADGGFGGSKRDTPLPHALPARAPDIVCDSADPAGNGADLPSVRRRQCAACRPGFRQGRRFPAPDFARPRHLRGRRPRVAQGGLRL